MAKIEEHAWGTPAWYDLMTPDIAKARDFYTKLFGWQYDVHGAEAGDYSMALLDGSSAAGLGSMPPDAPYPTAWTVYFNVEDADATTAAIRADGGTILMGPMDVFEEGRLVVAADPTGAVFGLWQPRRHRGAGVRDQHGAMTWQECRTRDGKRASEFYGRVFGLDTPQMQGMDYWMLNRGAQHHGGVCTATKMLAELPPHWLVYFAVDDTDAVVATAQASGGRVLQPPIDIPHGRMAVLADPFGAVFGINQPPAR